MGLIGCGCAFQNICIHICKARVRGSPHRHPNVWPKNCSSSIHFWDPRCWVTEFLHFCIGLPNTSTFALGYRFLDFASSSTQNYIGFGFWGYHFRMFAPPPLIFSHLSIHIATTPSYIHVFIVLSCLYPNVRISISFSNI